MESEEGCLFCALSSGEIEARIYYSDATVTMVDCPICGEGRPIVVFNHHGEVTEVERERALRAINSLYGYASIVKEPRHSRDHEHWHLEGEIILKDPTSCHI